MSKNIVIRIIQTIIVVLVGIINPELSQEFWKTGKDKNNG